MYCWGHLNSQSNLLKILINGIFTYVEVGISKISNCLKQSLKSIQTSYGVYALKQMN